MDEKLPTAVLDRSADAWELDRRPVAREPARGGPSAPLWLGSFAIGTEMFVTAGLLGRIAGDLGITVGVAGLTVTAAAVAYAVGAPLLGAALGRQPPRRILIGSLVIFGLCAVTSAAAPTVAVLLVSRVLGGLAASVYGPAAAAAAVRVQPERHHGRALGVLQAASSVAMLAGAPVGLLLAATASWRAAFGLVAVVAAIASLGLLRRTVGSAPPTPTTMRDRFRPLRSAAVVGSLAGTVLLMAASNSMYSYLGVLIGGAAETVGFWALIAAFGIGGVLGTWYGGTAADRWGGAPVALTAGIMLTAGLAALPLVAAFPAAAMGVLICWGFAGWGFVPGQQHRLLGLGSGSAPILLALNGSAIQLGFAAGALLGGLVVDTAGAGDLWILAVGCGAAGIALLGLTVPGEVRQ